MKQGPSDRRASRAYPALWVHQGLGVLLECQETGAASEHQALWAKGALMGVLGNRAQWVQWESLEPWAFLVDQA